MQRGSSARAALLAATMNFVPAAPLDILRFLRVPAIVMTIRNVRGRVCHDHSHRPPRRAARSRF
jgi:hypothetical protein